MMRSAAALAALLILPVLARGQEVAAGGRGTHEVVRGETLWALAGRYLGDPYRWPLLYEANQGLIKDPHRVYPGQVLAIPGLPSATVTDVAVVVAPQGAMAAAAAAEASVAPAMPARATAPPQVAPPSGLPPCPPPEGRTIFYAGLEGQRGCRLEVLSPEERTTFYPRPEEVAAGVPEVEVSKLPAFPSGLVYSAEWLEPWGAELSSLGTIQRLAGVAAGQEPRDRVLPFERVYLTPAPGARFRVGDVLQSVRVLRSEEGFGEVIRPTGILTVTQVEEGGATAWVTAEFDFVRLGDAVRAAPAYQGRSGVEPVPVQSNVEATVLGFPLDLEMHGYGALAFLDVGEAEGIAGGDEFVGRVNLGEGFAGIEAVRLQVILVRGGGSTARVVALNGPALRAGTRLQLVKKMR